MLAAIVTLFHPTKDQLENLRRLSSASGLDLLILVQNSSEELPALDIPKSVLIKNGNIGGIAGAFNRGAHIAFEKGADTVVLLDQDSEVPKNFFPQMLHFMRQKNAEMAAPDFIDVNSNTRGTYFKFGFWKLKKQPPNGDIESNVAISSGTFISKYAFEITGDFREDLIIDHVDTDFNFRAYLVGINISINRSVLLEHSIGLRTQHHLFGILTIKPAHHSALRHYYRTRNGIALIIKYFAKSPALAWLIFKWIIHDILGLIFYENNKITNLTASLRGIFHGIREKLGPS